MILDNIGEKHGTTFLETNGSSAGDLPVAMNVLMLIHTFGGQMFFSQQVGEFNEQVQIGMA